MLSQETRPSKSTCCMIPFRKIKNRQNQPFELQVRLVDTLQEKVGMEIRIAPASGWWALTEREQQGAFWEDSNVLYLVLVMVHKGIYIGQNSPNAQGTHISLYTNYISVKTGHHSSY